MCSLIAHKYDLALVGDGVDLDLARVRFELRDDDRMIRRDLARPLQNPLQLVLLVRNAHCGAAQYVARAHEYRVAAEALDRPRVRPLHP